MTAPARLLGLLGLLGLLSLSGCMITPLQTAPAPPAKTIIVEQPAPQRIIVPAAAIGQPGFTYSVTDQAGKQVAVHYDGGDHQQRLSIAVRPDGTVLLTSSQTPTDNSTERLAEALRLMEQDPATVIIDEQDYYPPPADPCHPCDTDTVCEQCDVLHQQRINRALIMDPVEDGK